MKILRILMSVGMLCSFVYLAYNVFSPMATEPVNPTVDSGASKVTSVSETSVIKQADKRKKTPIEKKPVKKIKLATKASDIDTVDMMDEDSPSEIRDWRDGLASTADDPVESADALRYSLEKQPIDPEWSAEATDTLEKVIGDEYLSKQLGLLEVDCRATMCRLELDPDSEESLSKLESNLALLQGTPFTHFIIESYEKSFEETEESNKAVVYITRNEEYVASANSQNDEDFFEE